MTYYHGSYEKIDALENGEVMFFTADEDEAAEFADAKTSECQPICYLYKIEVPDDIDLETIDDFGLFDCAYQNHTMIKGEGWCHPELGWVALLNPGNYSIELIATWESDKVKEDRLLNAIGR